ncbi:hypothetical protein K2Z84_31995 [Candidatus Binatia bacterium]|nr:hypothetical protein [Candidatus Binatia bacterium]
MRSARQRIAKLVSAPGTNFTATKNWFGPVVADLHPAVLGLEFAHKKVSDEEIRNLQRQLTAAGFIVLPAIEGIVRADKEYRYAGMPKFGINLYAIAPDELTLMRWQIDLAKRYRHLLDPMFNDVQYYDCMLTDDVFLGVVSRRMLLPGFSCGTYLVDAEGKAKGRRRDGMMRDKSIHRASEDWYAQSDALNTILAWAEEIDEVFSLWPERREQRNRRVEADWAAERVDRERSLDASGWTAREQSIPKKVLQLITDRDAPGGLADSPPAQVAFTALLLLRWRQWTRQQMRDLVFDGGHVGFLYYRENPDRFDHDVGKVIETVPGLLRGNAAAFGYALQKNLRTRALVTFATLCSMPACPEPGYRRIARAVGCSLRTIKLAIDDLLGANLIERIGPRRKPGNPNPQQFRIVQPSNVGAGKQLTFLMGCDSLLEDTARLRSARLPLLWSAESQATVFERLMSGCSAGQILLGSSDLELKRATRWTQIRFLRDELDRIDMKLAQLRGKLARHRQRTTVAALLRATREELRTGSWKGAA